MKTIRSVPFILLGLLSLGASIYIFANGFELATNVNLPYVSAIEPVDVAHLIKLNLADQTALNPKDSIGNFGEPKYLKISSQTSSVALIPAIVNDGEYIARASVGHFVYLAPAKSGDLGTTLIYIRQGWRTISNPNQIEVGSNLFIDTNKDWRYMYRVSDASRINTESQFLLPDGQKPQIMLVLLRQDNSMYVVVADFIDIQNIQQ